MEDTRTRIRPHMYWLVEILLGCSNHHNRNKIFTLTVNVFQWWHHYAPGCRSVTVITENMAPESWVGEKRNSHSTLPVRPFLSCHKILLLVHTVKPGGHFYQDNWSLSHFLLPSPLWHDVYCVNQDLYEVNAKK